MTSALAPKKICLVHNCYGKFSGEEAVVHNQMELLESHGHTISSFIRSSAEIQDSFGGQAKAFFTGIYNPVSVRKFRAFLTKEKPDLIHIHNLYPLISPSILDVCSDHRLPVVMTVHNYRLVCPNGLLMTNGSICELCTDGKEYWCLLRNCEGDYLKSLGYAIRNSVARLRKTFSQNISFFMVLSSFQKTKLENAGLPPNKIVTIPNMCKNAGTNFTYPSIGEYVAYAGRVSIEKGVLSLIKAAELCPDIPCKIAGTGPIDITTTDLPNCEIVGFLQKDRLTDFLRNSRIIIFPSICYETFGLTIIETMLQGKPVIASRIGGIPEIVDDGVTGLLFEPGNEGELAEKTRYLWERPVLCQKMGEAGRKKALSEYSPEIYYERLMAVYNKAIENADAE